MGLQFIALILCALNCKIKIFMKHVLLLVGLFSFAISVAQGEFLNKSNTIAPAGSGMTISNATSPSVFTLGSNTTSTSPSAGIEKKNIEFTQNNDFINPGDLYKDKMNTPQTGENYKVFRKNQYLGDVKSNSEYVQITFRDFGEVDGDLIKILVNDHVVTEQVYLEGDFKGIKLGLEKGFNRIDFVALNQGSSGPNTAEFRIFDDKGALVSSNQWNLATGFKATIIIVKD